MKREREVGEVISQMLVKIPLDEVDLRHGLIQVREDSGWKPPEGQYICWRRGSEVLFDRFGEPPVPEGWPKEIFEIWTGKS